MTVNLPTIYKQYVTACNVHIQMTSDVGKLFLFCMTAKLLIMVC